VFARADSVAVPAILPDGRIAEDSLATGLEPQEPDQMPRPTGREQLGSPDAALGTLDPAPLHDADREAGDRR
jgi:NADH-quinone oxidoreductase subunit J